MYEAKHLMILKVLTPMHVGGGNEIGAINSPIQREIHTNFPKIEASSLKGCVRNAFRSIKDNSKYEDTIFGSADKDNMYSSAVSFTDARILFFPVRSAKGIFAYVTCPFVLKRFFSELKALKINTDIDEMLFEDYKSTIITSKECLIDNNVILEEYLFSDVKSEQEGGTFKKFVSSIATFLPQEGMKKDLLDKSILISDDEFLYFVEMATDVITRIKVEIDTGTTDGGLFDEEYLPTESILYSFLFIESSKDENCYIKATEIFDLMNRTFEEPFQIGGNSTLGKGFTLCRLIKDWKMEVQL